MKAVRIDGLKAELADVDYDLIRKEYESYTQKGKTNKASAHKKLLDKLDEARANGATIDENTIKAAAEELIKQTKTEIDEHKAQIKALKEECSIFGRYTTSDEDDSAFIVAMMGSL